MPPPLHVRDDAAADIDEAYRWYDTRSTGVGDQFLSEVRRALTALEGAPVRYPIIRDLFVGSSCERFPMDCSTSPIPTTQS